MSWLLILLLVLIFVIFAVSCIVIIAWITAGAPNVTVANTLDVRNLSPCLLASANNAPATTTAEADADAAPRRRLLADTESGFVMVEPPDKVSLPDGRAEAGDNRLVQTLYIDGRAAVSRTTSFAQAPEDRAAGPLQVQEGDAQREIVEWHAHNLKTAPGQQTPGHGQGRGEDRASSVDVGGLLNRAARLRELRAVDAQRDERAAEEDAAAHQSYGDLRREELLPALALAAEKRDIGDRLADARGFHIWLPRDAALCTTSSTLTIPVELSVPRAYAVDDPTLLEHRQVRWTVHEMTRRDPTAAVQLWSSPLIPLADVVRADHRLAGTLSLHTQIDCRHAANKLLRLSLADDTPGRRQREVFCATHFHPVAAILGGPPCLGPDLRTAWATHQKILHSS